MDGLMIQRKQVSDSVTLVQFDHGRVSALDVEFLIAIRGELAALADTGTALVVTGTGSAFSAGVDLVRLLEGGPDYVAKFIPALVGAFDDLFAYERPVVAAVNGHAIAGGCVLALACDLRLMAAGRIGLTELSVGVPFPSAAREITRYALGPAAARVVLRADTLEAADAVRVGLVDDVVPEVELLDRAVALAARLAGHGADAYAFEKHQLHRTVREAVTAVGDGDVVRAWTSPATRDRLSAQLAKLSRGDRR
jgi:enoyl-CoA hydratase